MKNDVITILNYPGSKKRLLDFINETIRDLLPKGKTICDIFCGTSAVGYSFKDDYRVVSNDAEIYCYHIARSLVLNHSKHYIEIKDSFRKYFLNNMEKLESLYPEVKDEVELIKTKNIPELVDFYLSFKNVWQEGYKVRNSNREIFDLFSTYYSNSYFGLYQSFQIDSIRYAIEMFKGTDLYDVLLSSLYFAMKEGVFSKDGHMAQPLNVEKKSSVLIKRRAVDIFEKFEDKVNEYDDESFIKTTQNNLCYNEKLDELLKNNLLEGVDLVYADPPYTDMQYSRYFHLLETVTKYDYPNITKKNGIVSTGLYREDRFQSPLSQHGKAKKAIEDLVSYCAKHNITVVFSYAYPVDLLKQKSDRYTMSIEELKFIFEEQYGKENTLSFSENFQHCNNQNSEAKKVFEYLIVGRANR